MSHLFLFALSAAFTLMTISLPLQAQAKAQNTEGSNSGSRQQLANSLGKDFQLPHDYVFSTLKKARFHPSIIDRMNTPYEARPYSEYRPLFVNHSLANMGRSYIKENKAVLSKVEKDYGVQPGIIAAVLGMETKYGRNRGKDRVLDSLYTLATGHPRRANFFRQELGHFLTMCREEDLLPEQILGSYAGAFGTTQFIPSSFRHFAVDADADGKRDIWESPPDIISSVGNYFREHGWDAKRPVAYWLPSLPSHPLLNELRHKGIKAWKPLKELRNIGLPDLPEGWQDDDRVTLIDLATSEGSRTVLIHYNFYVITRWNRSYNYAMAITELAEMLACEMCKTR
ncbi:MAG: lytic murein transglycosylase B [Mariprofundaceae bacterium]